MAERVQIETPKQATDVFDRLEKLAEFLDGSEQLQGRWFGEQYAGVARYWWRRDLRAVVTEILSIARIHGWFGARRSPEGMVRALAESIARGLFTNGFGEHAGRLVLELDDGRNGGGWSELAVADAIEKKLLEAARG